MTDSLPETLKTAPGAKPIWRTELLRRGPLYTRLKSVGGLLAVLVIALLVSPHSPRGGLIFLEAGNITDILRQVSEIGIISLGMTFVILTGGIDLSVGTVLALASSIVALMLTRVTLNLAPALAITVAMAAAILCSGLVGLLNGAIIARWRIQPFIVTLATMIGIRGLARWLTSNTNIDIGFGTDLASVFAGALSTKVVVIGSYVVLCVALELLLSKTIFGRYVRAVGDNEQAAKYAGLPIAKTKILAYTMTGLLAGYSGVLHAAQNHQGNPNSGIAYELEAIAAVVIGGTSLMGGSGSILGTVVGTLIMGVLTNILRLNNVDNNLEMIVKAIIIVAAVWLQQAGKETA
ncbi:MAG TPA: ABC transporter permease [Candidatus Sulfotelmatobacter sp.]|nr:ABC transporter permease [Candidatus Sulfotelmatobacter sp.]